MRGGTSRRGRGLDGYMVTWLEGYMAKWLEG